MVDAVRSVISMVWSLCYTSLLGDEFSDEMQGCVDCHDDQAFCESMDGSAGRSIIHREDKPILRIYTYFSEDKYLLFLSWKKSSAINLATSGWLVCQEMLPYPGISVDLCHQLVTHWAVVSQVNLSKGKSVLFYPCTAFNPTNYLNKQSSGWRKKVTKIHRVHHFVHLISSHFMPIWNHLTQTFLHPQPWPTAQLPEIRKSPFPSAVFLHRPLLAKLNFVPTVKEKCLNELYPLQQSLYLELRINL